ncbi:MAG: endolytic transglycosylase MltG [Gaiellaceae bacterium]
MAEPPRRLSLPPGYRIPRRRPNRGQIIRRRLVALIVLAGLVALLYGAVRVALGHGSGGNSPTTTVVKPLKILFPEGFTRRQMADRIVSVDAIARKQSGIQPALSSSKYLELTQSSALPGRFAGDRKKRTLEGFLFPATYDFLATTSTRQLVNDQLDAFRDAWKRVDLRYARSKNLTAYDVLIIASMVEKEALSPDERAKIAGVIYNRLHAHMTLGIDATLRYGLNLKPTDSLAPHLNSSNPYNTGRRFGLPPTPIANPGLASMQAAAHPDRKRLYLYYLRKPDKVHHYFTASYADFVAHEHLWGYIK